MMGKDVLIKMDAKLYAEVKKAVRGYTVDYPSIKNFVEKAVQQQLQKKMIDIESIPAEAFRTKKPLREFVSSKSKFDLCHLCGQVHLAEVWGEKNMKKTYRNDLSVCPRCEEIITHYQQIKKEDKRQKKK